MALKATPAPESRAPRAAPAATELLQRSDFHGTNTSVLRLEGPDADLNSVVDELALEKPRLERVVRRQQDLESVLGDVVAEHVEDSGRMDEVMMLGGIVKKQGAPRAPGMAQGHRKQKRQLEVRRLRFTRHVANAHGALVQRHPGFCVFLQPMAVERQLSCAKPWLADDAA